MRGVFAQNSVAGEARALIGTPTDDQIVSLRVRPTAFTASNNNQERWVGVIARHRDDRNYYYLTLRTGKALSLRKLVNGVITPIRSVPASIAAGTWYALKLEVTGATLRGYLNGNLVIQATDTTHASGRTGAIDLEDRRGIRQLRRVSAVKGCRVVSRLQTFIKWSRYEEHCADRVRMTLALGGLGAAQARPVIIEESAILAPPPGITYVRFGSVVGTNGEYALVTGDRPPALIEEDQQQIFDALLYRRVNGNWIFQRILAQGTR